jgi:hypothetical protein
MHGTESNGRASRKMIGKGTSSAKQAKDRLNVETLRHVNRCPS